MIQSSSFNQKTIDVKGANPVCVSFLSEISSVTAPALIAAFAEVVNNNHDEIHFFFQHLADPYRMESPFTISSDLCQSR